MNVSREAEGYRCVQMCSESRQLVIAFYFYLKVTTVSKNEYFWDK